MARLICRHCTTIHQVSVLQGNYKHLPCRSCGRPMTLGPFHPKPEAEPVPRLAEKPPWQDDISRPVGRGHLEPPPPETRSGTALATAPAFLQDAGATSVLPGRPRLPYPRGVPAPAAAGTTAIPAPAPPGEKQPPRAASGHTGGLRCPHCGARLRPGAVKCPACRSFLQERAGAEAPRSRAGQLLTLAIVLLSIVLVLLWLRYARIRSGLDLRAPATTQVASLT